MGKGREINCANAIHAKKQNNRMKYDCVATSTLYTFISDALLFYNGDYNIVNVEVSVQLQLIITIARETQYAVCAL